MILKSGIYCIKNKVNKKVYVGKAKNIIYRWNEHKSRLLRKIHHSPHLQRAWNLYGESDFEFYVLENCEEKLLDEREIYWIKKLRATNKKYGYNYTEGGGGFKSKHTEESKRKMSLSRIGLRLGVRHTEDTKQKMRDNHANVSGKNNPMYGRRGTNAPAYGRNFDKHPRFGKKEKFSSSIYFGVRKRKYKTKECWIAQIRIGSGKQIYIKSFYNDILAARAYDLYVMENNLPNPLNFPKVIHDINIYFIFLLFDFLYKTKKRII